MQNSINEYFKSVCEAFKYGNIESSYNKPILTLLEQYGCGARDVSGGRSGLAGENVDILLWHGSDGMSETEPFAGVEVKKIGGIDARARGGQIQAVTKRYQNAILTDNCTWRFYALDGYDAKFYTGVELISCDNGILKLRKDNIDLFENLIGDFMLKDPASVQSSAKLAEYMAIHARTIRSVITGILKEDGEGFPLIDGRQKTLPMFPELYGLYARIKGELRPMLNTRSFADMYAQTIVYGLFIARHNDTSPDTFDRYEAIRHLQEESPLLCRFFSHIASTGKLHPTLESVIDKLCALYRRCDISSLLETDASRDTIVHFYENFLTCYDPVLRKSLGVFYTPRPVVRYLVSMADRLLKEELCIEGGLSSNDTVQITVPSEQYTVGRKTADTKELTAPRVAVLDPACGTGTFHAEIIRYVKDAYFSGAREAFYGDYLQSENSLLSRLIGFEIMMTSYAVAHLNIRRAVSETLGAIPETHPPAGIYMTNTLAPPQSGFERSEQLSLFDFSAAITDEAYKADTWKTRRPIKVIIGNPPYLAASTNPYDISAYKTETDGMTKLKEKNPKWLGDDYVKFFRFAEQIIGRTGEGILTFVSNNGYLDNPTFRGMRASLLRTFDKIFIVNLHGNAKKNEVAPDGGKDENIFDIMQGISLFIGAKATKNTDWANVYYVDLWGTRESKFKRMEDGDIGFTLIHPDDRQAYFIPFGGKDNEVYTSGVGIQELFTENVVGVVTSRDALCIQDTYENVEAVLKDFQTKDVEQLRSQYKLGNDVRDWSVEGAINDIEALDGKITNIAYRPFDNRYTYYTGRSKGFHCMPRGGAMRYMLTESISPIGKNVGLVFPKGTNKFWDGAFISNTIIDAHFIDYPGRSIAYIAPLYLYNGSDNTWSPNLNLDALARLTEQISEKPSPIEVFDYIYGVLHDPVYRERYNEFLKRDFPRVPVADEGTFHDYAEAGGRLRRLHLMQEKMPMPLLLEPSTSDNLMIEAIKYKDGELYINKNKRILGIPEDVWNYRIGGYQVLDKWFKSHKSETLTIERFTHIENVAGLLAETIKIQDGLKALHLRG